MALSRTDLENRYNGPIPSEMLAQLEGEPVFPAPDHADIAEAHRRNARRKWSLIRQTCREIRYADDAAAKRKEPWLAKEWADEAARLRKDRLKLLVEDHANERRSAAEAMALADDQPSHKPLAAE